MKFYKVTMVNLFFNLSFTCQWQKVNGYTKPRQAFFYFSVIALMDFESDLKILWHPRKIAICHFFAKWRVFGTKVDRRYPYRKRFKTFFVILHTIEFGRCDIFRNTIVTFGRWQHYEHYTLLLCFDVLGGHEVYPRDDFIDLFGGQVGYSKTNIGTDSSPATVATGKILHARMQQCFLFLEATTDQVVNKDWTFSNKATK
mmetsp:Transcript_15765/g.34120  ORF Transcript_15765/g.34120 Transcript_15765/m.34120 type:complete len:200 (-) Transcript_15765:678-1277(-)